MLCKQIRGVFGVKPFERTENDGVVTDYQLAAVLHGLLNDESRAFVTTASLPPASSPTLSKSIADDTGAKPSKNSKMSLTVATVFLQSVRKRGKARVPSRLLSQAPDVGADEAEMRFVFARAQNARIAVYFICLRRRSRVPDR